MARPEMLNSSVLQTFLFVLVTSVIGDVAYAESFDDLHGFELGQTFADARANASARGWQLKASLAFPREWMVSGTNLSLYTCDDRIAAVRMHKAGTLDEFALIVDELQAKYGQPATTVSTFMAGATRISTIEAIFTGSSGKI